MEIQEKWKVRKIRIMKSSSNNQHRNEKIRKPYPFIIIIFQVSYGITQHEKKQVHYPSTLYAPFFNIEEILGVGSMLELLGLEENHGHTHTF